ncbi:MAG: bL21 family ribosomal protein, partial [Planctomycetota bacterium]
MFAIIEDGSRQYRVEVGRRVSLDYRSEAKDGDTLTLEKVMLANGGAASVVGKPLIEGAT